MAGRLSQVWKVRDHCRLPDATLNFFVLSLEIRGMGWILQRKAERRRADGAHALRGSRNKGRRYFAFAYLPSPVGIHGPPAIDTSLFQVPPSGVMFEMTRRSFAGFPSI